MILNLKNGFLCACLAVSASPSFAQSNRIWFTWENQTVRPDLCKEKNVCRPLSTYITRLGEQTSLQKAKEMTGSMDQLAKLRGLPVDHPDAPKTCQNVEAAKVLGFDPELWPISEKLDTLVNLPGVYFSLEKLKAPAGYEGPFGEQIHAEVTKKFQNAGIPVLTEKELETTPGQPHLNIYFSNTNPDTGCWFSVFASLSQTALLTRNHTVKFKAGTWGSSAGYSADDPNRGEYASIMMVVDKFIQDFKAANPNGLNLAAKKKL
jgi:hypothetical protein